MPEKPYISQGSNTGDDLYAMGAFPLGIGTFNPTDIINPGDTGLFAGFEPVMEAISTPNPGGILLEAKTVSGAAPLMISDAAKNQILSLLTNIKPVQDLHGYANPWPGGGNKNLLQPNVAIPTTIAGGVNVTLVDGVYVFNGTATSGTNFNLDNWLPTPGNPVPHSEGTLDLCISAQAENIPTGQATFIQSGYFLNGVPTQYAVNFGSRRLLSIAVVEGDVVYTRTYINIASGITYNNFRVKVQIEIGDTATEWTPYSNICPISGWTGCNVYISPTTNPADATAYPCVWQDEAGTVYGGQIDVATGWMEVTHKMLVLDGTQSTMSVNWRPSSTSVGWLYHYSYSKNKIYTGSQMPDIISDTFETCTYNQVYYSEKDDAVSLVTNAIWGIIIRCHDTSLTTKSAIDAYMAANPVTVVFRLDSYEYYQVPAVNIFTLAGTNYIWTDCGDQITVQYAAVK